MKIEETKFKGLFVIEPHIFGDERGYFFESFRKEALVNKGINLDFVQDNEACSDQFIFRGFHYQVPPFGQAKLVRVIKGSVIDMVIDIRKNSQTYGKLFQIELSEKNNKQLLVPEGFAHGYLSLKTGTIFSYKVSAYYNKESEAGISFADENLQIDWPVHPSKIKTSEKDKNLPKLGNHTPYE